MSRITNEVDQAGSEPETEAPRKASVATSHPRAVKAARDVLEAGGHAVEAAIAASLTLGVVDPMSTSLGGDAFALVWDAEAKKIFGLNGSGRAPQSSDASVLLDEGLKQMPQRGIRSVTVPGALRAYGDLHERWGKRPWQSLCAEAIEAASEGYALTPAVAALWKSSETALREGSGTECFLPGGEVPVEGENITLSALGKTLTRVAELGASALYEGELANEIVACSESLGGWLSKEDLASHSSEWVEPAEASYRGHPVFTLPPNGQGLVVLQALRILEDFPLSDYDEVERSHTIIEAMKRAFAEVGSQIGDPESCVGLASRALDEDFIDELRDAIEDSAGDVRFGYVGGSDTVYVATVDADGNACSLISSIYQPFGSCVVVPDTGLVLQNRGALFDLDPANPSHLAPGRRPYHTIIPSMAFRMSRPWLVFGVVGGFQQPQGQVQLLSNLVDEGMTVKEAVERPRWRWAGGRRLWLEAGFPTETNEGLVSRGHRVEEPSYDGSFGGAQCLLYEADEATWVGASDPRKDGLAVTFEVP